MVYLNIKNALTDWALNLGVPQSLAEYTTDAIGILLLLVFAKFMYFITTRVGLFIVKLFVEKSATRWDDILVEHKFFTRVSQIVPAFIIYTLSPVAIQDIPFLADLLVGMAKVYVIIFATLAVYSLVDSLYAIYQTTRLSSRFAIKGLLQAGKLILFALSTLLALSVLTSKTPIYFLSGIGALTAVLMLVFKDVILGLVAGIQLSANEMVSEGDWIEMPQFGADGDVIDVSLTTVKVQNFDKTITTIPTYSLISQSFKNWRGMQDSGGRRIKRSITINISSIKFCDDELLDRLSRIQLISSYIKERRAEIEAYNAENEVDTSNLINGRRMTNIGTFKRYIEEYLRDHPKVHKGMTFLIRQLPPSEEGIPIELYIFLNDQRWVSYEAIQSDIFDHLLASLSEFDLTVFQNPSGDDFRALVAS